MILYFTHNKKPLWLTQRFYEQNKAQAQEVEQEFRAVVAKRLGPTDEIFEFDETLPTYADIYSRILFGLNGVADYERIYLCEDDMLYPDERFGWAPPPGLVVCYNLNVVSLCERGFSNKPQNGIGMSQMFGTCAAIKHNVREKLRANLRGLAACIEPCSGQSDGSYSSGTCRYGYASVDFRSEYNATWKIEDHESVFQSLSGWGEASKLWSKYMER